MGRVPRPPLRLARRVGGLDPRDPWGHYDALGLLLAHRIKLALPEDWSWHGRRVLDFGCGVGRVLRNFATEAEAAEFWCCDIDRPSIEWLQRNLSPPFRPFLVGEDPALPTPDEHFDLIWAISVFTHVTDTWAQWMAELHRALKPDGLLVLSIMGPGMWSALETEPWSEDRIGMCVLRAGRPWSLGGPTVYHSAWWIREHWGRGFDVLEIDPGHYPWSHGWVVLRKRDGAVTPDALEALGDDPREREALRFNLELLQRADRELRPKYLRLVAADQRATASWWLRHLGSKLRR